MRFCRMRSYEYALPSSIAHAPATGTAATSLRAASGAGSTTSTASSAGPSSLHVSPASEPDGFDLASPPLILDDAELMDLPDDDDGGDGTTAVSDSSATATLDSIISGAIAESEHTRAFGRSRVMSSDSPLATAAVPSTSALPVAHPATRSSSDGTVGVQANAASAAVASGAAAAPALPLCLSPPPDLPLTKAAERALEDYAMNGERESALVASHIG